MSTRTHLTISTSTSSKGKKKKTKNEFHSESPEIRTHNPPHASVTPTFSAPVALVVEGVYLPLDYGNPNNYPPGRCRPLAHL
jgi:hypothetical protein